MRGVDVSLKVGSFAVSLFLARQTYPYSPFHEKSHGAVQPVFTLSRISSYLYVNILFVVGELLASPTDRPHTIRRPLPRRIGIRRPLAQPAAATVGRHPEPDQCAGGAESGVSILRRAAWGCHAARDAEHERCAVGVAAERRDSERYLCDRALLFVTIEFNGVSP